MLPSMPKRPCAIAVTQDDQTILCADKFGDVYALPLQHTSEDEQAFATKAEQAPKTFVPSATNLTVHTARNRKALEAQLKQQETQAKSKEPLRFKHELLLGHVSMLTDLLFVTLDAEDLRAESDVPAAKPRNYILTADRDEHIRISRGQPQSHVIEGFCLGHKEFISKMCLATPHALVSGGGDDHLFVWDWLKGRLLRKISLRDILSSIPDAGEFAGEKRRDLSIAVSGIWAVPQTAKEKVGAQSSKACAPLLIKTEGNPGGTRGCACIDLYKRRGIAQRRADPGDGHAHFGQCLGCGRRFGRADHFRGQLSRARVDDRQAR
ncbi:tRNA (guanine-N(7)-)-methyltransferase non-catalytic subunit trm82 [Diplodia seriata]